MRDMKLLGGLLSITVETVETTVIPERLVEYQKINEAENLHFNHMLIASFQFQ